MNVFISWSGERSRRVSLFLKEWLSCVIQSVRPWVSSRDIDRGSLWFSEISQQLGDTTVGIICLTQENKEKPWILFEAGALAKGLNSARVCTLLVDLEPKDIGDPLAQFNHTLPNREGLLALLVTLNRAAEASLDDRVLERAFETYWPQFEQEFSAILADTKAPASAKPRKTDDVLGEILEATRSMSSRLRILEDGEQKRTSMNDRSRLAGLFTDSDYDKVFTEYFLKKKMYDPPRTVSEILNQSEKRLAEADKKSQ